MDDHLDDPADAVSPYPSYYEGPRLDFPLQSNSKPGEFQNRGNRNRSARGHDLDCTLWVGNLDHRVSETIVRELFLQIGPIQSVVFPKKKEDPSKRRGFCFVNFFHPKSVPKAIETLGETVLFGRQLNLKCRPDSVHAVQNESSAPVATQRTVQIVDHPENSPTRSERVDGEDCRIRLKYSTRAYSPIRAPPSPERKFRRTVNIVRSFRKSPPSSSCSPERKVLVVHSSLNDSEPEVKIKIANNHRISSVVVTPPERRPSEPVEQFKSTGNNSSTSAATKIPSKIIAVDAPKNLENSGTYAPPPAEEAPPAPQKIPVVQIPSVNNSAQNLFPDSPAPLQSFGNNSYAVQNSSAHNYGYGQTHQNFQPPEDSYYHDNNNNYYYDQPGGGNWPNPDQQQRHFNRYFWYNSSQQYGRQQRYHPYQGYTNWNNYYPRSAAATAAPHLNPSFWSGSHHDDFNNYNQPTRNYQEPSCSSDRRHSSHISPQHMPLTRMTDQTGSSQAHSSDKHRSRSRGKHNRERSPSSSSSRSSLSRRRHYSRSSSSSSNNDQVTSSSHVPSFKSSRNENNKVRSRSGSSENRRAVRNEPEYDPNNPRY